MTLKKLNVVISSRSNMPEYVIFISKQIVSNAICRSENILWNFEVFVSLQSIPGVLLQSCSKNMPILHMLLLISRTAFHKNSFGRLLLILFNIFFIVMESTLYMRYFFMFYLFVLRMNFWTFHQKDYWKQTLLLLYFLIYITKATNKRHASEKGEELLRKKQVSNKWFFFVIESYLELFTNNSF